MSTDSAELCEAWTLRRRSGTQMARPATTYRIELDLNREFHAPESTTYARPDGEKSVHHAEKRLTDRIELDLNREFHAPESTTYPRPDGEKSVHHAEKRLTDRELQVIQLAATGATDREIADALFISRRTVTSHMANILFKLNVGNRTAAAVVASRSGLIV